MKKQAVHATFGILTSTLIWGFGFIATRWALKGFTPHWLNFLRMGFAGALGLAICLLAPKWRKHVTLSQLKLALGPGLLLAGLFACQTVGLTMTTVANSSFLTTLYVIFVPFFAAIFLRQSVSISQWLAVVLALSGTLLLCQYEGGLPNFGDVITIGCAVCAAMHFLTIEHLLDRIEHPFVFNVLQTAWAAIFCAVPAFLLEPVASLPVASHSLQITLIGLAFLVVPSSLLSFAIQIWAQGYLPAVTVSLLCLMESPIATLLGGWIFHETFTATQLVGALTIVVAAGLMIIVTWRVHRKEMRVGASLP